MYLRLALILLCSVVLEGISISAEESTTIEAPKRGRIIPQKPTKARDPRAEHEEKEKAAAQEAARQKEQAAEELKYRRQTDQRQIEIQEEIAGFTGHLVTIGGLQVGVAVIALLSIWVAWKAASAADRNVTIMERAWLIVRFDRPFEVKWGECTRVIYSILNTGRTIARFKHTEAFVTTHEGFPNLPVMQIDKTIYNTTRSIIFPNTPIEQSGETKRILESGTIEGIKNGSVKLIIRGFVVYDDIFNVRHITKFCQVYSPSWNDGIGGFVMPPDPKPGYENDAD